MKSPVDVTYLADTVILLRYFEALGRVRRAVSVIKKRTGGHEDTLREFRVTGGGLELGAPLAEVHGVLPGVPTFVGGSAPLFEAVAGGDTDSLCAAPEGVAPGPARPPPRRSA